MAATAEHNRLLEDGRRWKRWGPYLSERAWGTVREDYSGDGNAWTYFPHDHARSRAYRWNEDGLAGICDDRQWLCFALALWNGQDAILKERLFGLTGPEGNHGEDVKEYYFYLDSTPTHSYMQMLYKYPQRAFPYADLVETNSQRSRHEPEYELLDTGVFAENRYFDIFVEYVKATPEDLLIRVRAINRGPDPASLHLLPTLWFRNNWSWGRPAGDVYTKPVLRVGSLGGDGPCHLLAEHPLLGPYVFACAGAGDGSGAAPELLFTENETNLERLYHTPNRTPYVKDGIHRAVVHGETEAVNPMQVGTKAAAHYRFTVLPGATATIRLRLTVGDASPVAAFGNFDALVARRRAEADAFYATIQPAGISADLRRIQRQALAGMLWSKQFYAFNLARWLSGDPDQPPPPADRRRGRNRDWAHLSARDILSMPDKWEYPWFAAWDLAFHCVPLALVDLAFAKEQLKTLGQEWYQHPNGQIPAYEWNFDDVNPPVLAWATWRVYRFEQERDGMGDRAFLEFMFHKLALNFTWWVNRKDGEGNNLFAGGFLGLDNIGVFDRNMVLPSGTHLEQSDATSWMALFCLNMVTIALELADHRPAYGEIALKYLYHLLYILAAMENIGAEQLCLWDPADQFFYDVLYLGPQGSLRLKVRSLVGLIPLLSVATFEQDVAQRLPEIRERVAWFVKYRPHLAEVFTRWREPGAQGRQLLAICRRDRLEAILRRVLDEDEFLSPYGVRALSRYHAEHPYLLCVQGQDLTVAYVPAESDSCLFGGNSNWRGPIWFPVNYLLIEALLEYHRFFGDDFTVECPTGSGRRLTLGQVAEELAQRLISIFARDDAGRRAVFGQEAYLQRDPHWRDYVPFHEYFHGDTGRGVGASHQTGWTGLVASLIQEQADRRG